MEGGRTIRISFVNNIPTLCGGTLGCTKDMVASLPDFEHQIVSFGDWGTEEREAFKGVRLDTCLSRNDVGLKIREFSPEIVIFQNTSPDRMPNALGSATLVYYTHSTTSRGSEARARCHHSFVVSQYLAQEIGLSQNRVLYQPVSAPPKPDGPLRRNSAWRVAGRMATPGSSKWKPEDYWPHCMAVHAADRQLRLEFVGHKPAPTGDDRIGHGNIGYGFRSDLWHWDYLLNPTKINETYGRTICEAQRASCVPIVSPRGGMVEQIEDGVTGFFADTPEEYAAVVKKLSDDGLRMSIQSAAKEAGDKRGSLKTWRKEFLTRIAK